MLHQAFPAFVLMLRSNAIQPNDTCNSLYTYAPSTTFCLHTRHILLLQYTNRYITVSSTFFTKSKYYSFYSPNVIFFISFLHISQHFLYYYIFRVANYFLNRYVTVQTPVNQCHLLKLEKLALGLNTSESGFSEDIFTFQAIRKPSSLK